MVRGLQEPPRRADAVALGRREGRRPPGFGAPLRPRNARPNAGRGQAVRRFLHFYGPATSGDFAEWAGVARMHAERIWNDVEGELDEVEAGTRTAWVLTHDADALASPPTASVIRLIPAGDPYLQKPNRALLAPDDELRKRLFRPVASPGAVLMDGRLAGLWRIRARGRRAEITVERFGRLTRKDLEEETGRIADLRGASEAVVVVE